MTPSHAKKTGRRYRYYIGQTADRQPLRIPAQELEGIVIEALIGWLTDETKILAALADQETRTIQKRFQRGRELAEQIRADPRAHIANCLQRITIGRDSVSIAIRLGILTASDVVMGTDDPMVVIQAPATPKRCGNAVRLIVKAPGVQVRRTPDTTLMAMLARSYEWLEQLTSGRASTIAAIAEEQELPRAYVGKVINLALLDPSIVQRIARNDHPPELNAERLIRLSPLPSDWGEQRVLLGID